VYQDEVETHKLPALTRVWAEVGSQPEVPSPGKNEKRVIYGGIDYLSGKISYTVGLTKSGVNFLAFLIALAAAFVLLRPEQVRVPGVVGRDQATAARLVTAAGLRVRVTKVRSDQPSGVVIGSARWRAWTALMKF